MFENIKLSIITINYNSLCGLKRTVESVLNQTWKNFEYIIIDGGSTDGSKDFINSIKDRLSYFVSEKDNGIYNAMNKGIKVAKGDYLLFLNSGDYLETNDILDKVKHEFNSDASFVTCAIIMDNGMSNWVVTAPQEMTFGLVYHHTIMHPSTFIHRRVFEKYGLYNEDNEIVSDWELFFKAFCLNGESYKCVNLTLTHFDTNGISSSKLKEGLNERLKIIDRHFYHLIKSPYGKYLLDNTLYENRRLVYLKNIEKSTIMTKILTVIMLVISKISMILSSK